MKKFMMLVILFFTVGCSTITTKSVPVEKDIQVQHTEKKVLYTRANNWVSDNFNHPKSVVKFTDKGYGTISGRYLLGTIAQKDMNGPARYAFAAVKIKVQNNSSKITIKPEPFSYAKSDKNPIYTEIDVQRDVLTLIGSFEKAMLANK